MINKEAYDYIYPYTDPYTQSLNQSMYEGIDYMEDTIGFHKPENSPESDAEAARVARVAPVNPGTPVNPAMTPPGVVPVTPV